MERRVVNFDSKPMTFHSNQILELFQPSGIILEVRGSAELKKIAPVEEGGEGDLVFVDKKEFLPFIEKNKPTAVVTSSEFFEKILNLNIPVCILAKNVGVAHALMKQKFGDWNWYESEWGKVHPSAVIHESTKIPASCIVGPNVVIGQNCKIGERVIIQANTVIEENVTIGEDTKILSQVFIGRNTEIGSRVWISYGAVIGGEGFGFAPDEHKVYYRIPQTGRVIIEDDVRIGSNCCIDRAAYKETRIGKGVKFDNLVHVAHNVQIGENSILIAQVGIAGSTKIGKRVILSGQVGVLDHLNVCDDSIFLVRAGITQDVTKPGVYSGLPLLPIQDYMKQSAVLKKLVDMRNELKELQKEVESLRSQKKD